MTLGFTPHVPQDRIFEDGVTASAVLFECRSFWRVLDELHINNLAVHPRWRRR